MTITEILNDPLFNKSEIAISIWPESANQKTAGSRLSAKIRGKAGQRLTENDIKKIVDLFKDKYNIELEPI